jgi:hypothetical protein
MTVIRVIVTLGVTDCSRHYGPPRITFLSLSTTSVSAAAYTIKLTVMLALCHHHTNFSILSSNGLVLLKWTQQIILANYNSQYFFSFFIKFRKERASESSSTG